MKEIVKAGLIVAVSLLILSGFIILIGGSQFFNKFDHYYVKVTNAAGLEVGAQVRLGGVRVGRVLEIKAPKEPGQPVTIEIGIKKGTPLYKGTKAYITQVGFVGDIYLLLSVDNTSNERIDVGGVIPSEELVQFSILMKKLEGISESLDGLLKDISRLFSPKNVEEIERLFGNTNKAIVSGSSNFEKIALALKNTTDKLELVLKEVEGVVRDNKGEVSHMIKKAREDLDRAEDTIKTIDKTAKSIDKTSQSIDRAVDLQSQNLDDLINSMTKTTEELQIFVQEMKAKPWSLFYKEGAKE
jgi:phospholipid/cholesterol/gamma-HCH transport system substrate-binding protein